MNSENSNWVAEVLMGFLLGMLLMTLIGVNCDTPNMLTYTDSTKIDLVKKGHATWIINEKGKPEWKLKVIE